MESLNHHLVGKPSVEKRWLNNVKDEGVKKIDKTLFECAYFNNIKNMNNIVFSFFGTDITYEEFFENVYKISRKFKQLGVNEGDVVPLIMANTPESAYCFYALNSIGAVACMIDPRLNEYGLMRDLNLVDNDIVVGITNTCRILRKIKDKTKLKEIIMLSAMNSAKSPIIRGFTNFSDFIKGNRVPKNFVNWNKFMADEGEAPFSQPQNFQNKPAAIVFTGGTTGVHKGVILSNEAINTTVYAHSYLIDGIEPGEKFLDILPPFIAYGLTSLHLSLYFGMQTILDPVSNPKMFAKEIAKYRPSIVFGGPIHWEAFASSSKAKKMKLDFLKFPVSGGEELPIQTADKVNKILRNGGCETELLNGYGATECCGVFSLKFGAKNTKGTVGFPLRFNNMCILDLKTKEEKDYNEVGEVCISGPSIMNEYYKNDTETEEVFITDAYGRRWLETGDLGKINEKGELVIIGRLKRVFVCGVNKVYPSEMERLIMSIEGIRKCVVTGVNDEVLRIVPKVHVLLDKAYFGKENYIKNQIKKLISERLGDEVLPKYYSFNQEFLYTGSGKIDYVRMADKDNELLDNQKILLKKKI